ncbi:hypothetical protein H2201_001628 [Coniosporium apollinis]|uniref:Peptidase A1 domain-containing protein n=1 Tax=Coniosporium apollinis TaxID=61459 RepID=A0ABQ9P0U1_9PEZI|nr:hypothetical protein H2201_001628 [Coniosporium apollinis]
MASQADVHVAFFVLHELNLCRTATATQMLPYLWLGLWATCVVSAWCHPLVGEDQAPLRAQGSRPTGAPILLELTRGTDARNDTLKTRGGVPLQLYDDRYYLNLDVGGQPLNFHVDTGSQTFWAARTNYRCFNSEDHEWAKGDLGQDRVIVGDLQFSPALGAAVDARFEGSGIETGLLGLAGPGTLVGDKDYPKGQKFAGFFPQLVEAASIENVFSVALSRSGSPSWIEFGGRLKDVKTVGRVAHADLFTVTKPAIPGPQLPGWGLYKVGGETVEFDEPLYHTLLDTGSESFIVPGEVALRFNQI